MTMHNHLFVCTIHGVCECLAEGVTTKPRAVGGSRHLAVVSDSTHPSMLHALILCLCLRVLTRVCECV